MTHFTQRIINELLKVHQQTRCPYSCKVCVLCTNYANPECAAIVADLKAERDGQIVDF